MKKFSKDILSLFTFCLVLFPIGARAIGSMSACYPGGRSCDDSLRARNECELFVASCAAQLNGKSYEKTLKPHIIQCRNIHRCESRSTESLLNGCKAVGLDGLESATKVYVGLKAKMNQQIEACVQRMNERDPSKLLVRSDFHKCMLEKLPSLPGVRESFTSFRQQFSILTEWFASTGRNVRESMDSDCARSRNKKSSDHLRCRFDSGMNALLSRMQAPYEKLGLKETTDKITEAFVMRLVEHRMQKGCFDSKGTGLEFCLVLAGIAEGGLTVAEALPLPVSGGKKALGTIANKVIARTNFVDIELPKGIPVVEGLKSRSPKDLERILTDEAFAQKLADELGVNKKSLKRDSAILMSRAHSLDRLPGQVVERELFQKEAAYLGYTIEPLKETYRLDGRSPKEVLAAGGFKPNPNRESGTLWEHTRLGYEGTGNYVSTSVKSANSGTLLNPDFFDGSRIKKGTPPEKLSGYFDKPQVAEAIEYERYEYKITNTEGVVLRNADYAEEMEAVIRDAGPNQIEYRKIRIRQKWIETKDEDGEYLYTLTPLKKIDVRGDISFSDWKPLGTSP